MKRIAILGSTGSIGTQALEVIAEHPSEFSVEVLTAQNQADLLITQALAWKPAHVVIGNEAKYAEVKADLEPDQSILIGYGFCRYNVMSDLFHSFLSNGVSGCHRTILAKG